jgi:hypothetical protein
MIIKSLEVTRVSSPGELIGIRDLQALNLKQNITAEEAIDQGFLTAVYTIDYLQEMNSASPSIIAKDNDKVVGYALVVTKESRKGHDLIDSLFDAIDESLRFSRRSNQAFGGVQILMIGDLFQLPPVVRPFEKELLDVYYKSEFFFDT